MLEEKTIMNRTRSIVLFLLMLSVPLAFAAEDVKDLTDWKARLASKDQKIQDAALHDWFNGYVARDASADEIVPLFLPFIKSYAVKRDDIAMTGLIIQYMSRRFGPKARAALPDLIKLALDDTATFYMRGQAIEGLGYIAEKDPEVVAVLIKVLENPKPTSISGVHDRAAGVLGKMGAAAESARPALTKLMEHEWDIHQDAAYIALGRIAEADLARPLAEQIERLGKLKELSVSESSAAFLAVTAAGENKNPQAKMALAALERIIANESKTKPQRAAIQAVIAIGPGSEPSMVRALLKATLKDRLPYASRALVAVDGTNPAAVEPLVEALKEYWDSSNWTDSYYISQTLELYGVHARPAVPLLIKALLSNNSEASQVQSYLQVLRTAGAQDPETLPAILTVLSPESTLMKTGGTSAQNVRCQLLSTIGILGFPHDGPVRENALKQVAENLKSDDAEVFISAAFPAGESASEEMVPLLMRGLDANVKFRHPKEDFRSYELDIAIASVSALGKLGPLAVKALPAVSAIAARTPPEASFDFKRTQAGNLIGQAIKAKAAIEKK